jgi:hypothetical protein
LKRSALAHAPLQIKARTRGSLSRARRATADSRRVRQREFATNNISLHTDALFMKSFLTIECFLSHPQKKRPSSFRACLLHSPVTWCVDEGCSAAVPESKLNSSRTRKSEKARGGTKSKRHQSSKGTKISQTATVVVYLDHAQRKHPPQLLRMHISEIRLCAHVVMPKSFE